MGQNRLVYVNVLIYSVYYWFADCWTWTNWIVVSFLTIIPGFFEIYFTTKITMARYLKSFCLS